MAIAADGHYHRIMKRCLRPTMTGQRLRGADVIILASAAFIATSAPAEELRGVMLSPDDMRWAAAGDHQVARLVGDPSNVRCPSVVRIKLSGNTDTDIAAEGQDKIFTVISGSVSVHRQEKDDSNWKQILPPGSFLTMSAGGRLKLAAVGETVVQITAFAPADASRCTGQQPSMLVPESMRWEPFGLAHRTVLMGNPDAAECPVVVRYRFPAGTKFPQHVHVPHEDRVFTVMSGTVYHGFGPQWDDSALKKLPAQSVYTVPGGAGEFRDHSTEGVLQRETLGPTPASCETWPVAH
jgi:hypothetical protein